MRYLLELQRDVPWADLWLGDVIRKLAAGNVYDATGDAKAALDWVGDTDPRRMREYLKRRDDRIEAVAEAVNQASAATQMPHGALVGA